MLTVKLAYTTKNFKAVNGWNFENERIYKGLTPKQKEAINILIITEFNLLTKRTKSSFKELVKKVKNNSNVIELVNDVILKVQTKKLRAEIKNQLNKNKN